MSFAITNGDSNVGSTWDTGVVPSSSEDVYANGFTVNIIGTFTVGRVSNGVSPVSIVNIATPKMTSNNSPSGNVFSNNNSASAYNVFAQDTFSTFWSSGVVNSGIIGYQWASGLIMKQYSFWTAYSNNSTPKTWTFEGSNNGSSWTVLDTQTNVTLTVNTLWQSSILANSTSYTYYRLNVTATFNAATVLVIGELQMSTSSILPTISQGGTFNLTNGSNLVLTDTNTPIVVGTTTTAVITSAISSPSSATITANSTGFSLTANVTGILRSGSGTLNIVGNLQNSAGTVTSGVNFLIRDTSSGILNIIGNLASVGNSSQYSAFLLYTTGTSTINITGIVSGGGGGPARASAIYATGANNIYVTGNIIGNYGEAIVMVAAGNVYITGNVTGGTNNPAIYATAPAAFIDIAGIITAGNGAPAVSSVGLVKISGVLNNVNRYSAIYSPQWTIESTTTSWRHQTFAGPDLTLYASGASLGNPNTFDVRDGVTYGPSGTLTGTLKVPSPSNVLQGVQTDATVGTLLLTAQAFWEQLTSGVSLTGSFGKLIKDLLDVAISSRSSQTSLDLIPINPLLDNDVRIDDIKDKTDKIPNNPASIQSTGDQIASYIT